MIKLDKNQRNVAIEIAQKHGFDIRDVNDLLRCGTSPEETVELLKKKDEKVRQNSEMEMRKKEAKERAEAKQQKRMETLRAIASDEWLTSDGQLEATLKETLKTWGLVFISALALVLFVVAYSLIWAFILLSIRTFGVLALIFGLAALLGIVSYSVGIAVILYCLELMTTATKTIPKWLFRRAMRRSWQKAFVDGQQNVTSAEDLINSGAKPSTARRLIKRKNKKLAIKAKSEEQQMLRRKIVEKYCDVEIQGWYEQKRTMCYEVYMSATESVRRFEYTRLYCFALIILLGGGLLPTFALWATTSNPLIVLAPILFAMVAFFVLLPSLYLIIFHVRSIRLWLDRKENPRFEKLVKNKIRNKIMYGKRDSGTEGMQESPAL